MRTFLTILVITSAVGCATQEPPPYTAGDLGRANFLYRSGNGFVVGGDMHPALDRPMMVGASEIVGIENGGVWLRVPPLVASSNDDAVMRVTAQTVQCTTMDGRTWSGAACASELVCPADYCYRYYEFGITAIAPGTAQLELRDSAGAVYDRTTLSSKSASRLVVERQLRRSDAPDAEAPVVSSLDVDLYGSPGNNGGRDADAPIWIRPQDADGNWLVASTGVVATIANPTIADQWYPAEDRLGSSFRVVPHALGTTTLSASAGALRIEVPIHVK